MDGGDYLKDAKEGTTAEESASLSLKMDFVPSLRDDRLSLRLTREKRWGDF